MAPTEFHQEIRAQAPEHLLEACWDPRGHRSEDVYEEILQVPYLTWPMANLLNFWGIPYLVGRIKFKLLVQDPLAKWEDVYKETLQVPYTLIWFSNAGWTRYIYMMNIDIVCVRIEYVLNQSAYEYCTYISFFERY